MSDAERPSLDRVHAHNLLLLYFAVAYGADRDFDDAEEQAIGRVLATWLPDASEREVGALVQAAFDLYIQDDALSVEGLALGLRSVLPLDLREQVLADMSRVARADGEAVASEVTVIDRVRAIWDD